MTNNKTILVTGGCGYIGSHCVVELLDQGYKVIIVDDLRNSKIETIGHIKEITESDNLQFYNFNLCNYQDVYKIFDKNNIDGVMHFAADKSVGMSIKNPLNFYQNNLTSTLNLLKAMKNFNVNNIIFSSSATVYDSKLSAPYFEKKSLLKPNNPYGRSKLYIEEILNDICVSDGRINCAILRYFNPIGAHPSGKIGENSINDGGNLGPALVESLKSKNKVFKIFGHDYDTKDGTCIRDFIHVCDLSKGHINALNFILNSNGTHIWNLGSGNGYSVLEAVRSFEKAIQIDLNIKFCTRRDGDIPISFASTKKAENDLNWTAKIGLDEMMSDLFEWSKKNI
jgi:UDP-glucose 4-epimerase